ncbi:MAG: hypothetical protein LBL46_02145 [Rickettsiales bacterium]|jgi:hypothetical protein|nr:hypothetical protein [Rickettsiales bacterium]
MKKILPFALVLLSAPLFAADRTTARNRAAANATTPRATQTIQARAAAVPTKNTSARAAATIKNATPKPVSVRAATNSAIIRAPATKAATARAAALTKIKSNHEPRTANPAPPPAKRAVAVRAAATTGIIDNPELLGADYAICRDAYFSCMDQFCALRNEQYRRCTCSARLEEMRTRERNFSAAAGMIQTFQDNNLAVVGMKPNEVKSMYNAADGELGLKEDKSTSAAALTGITDVLSTKSADSGARMNSATNIWSTTDMIGGADIASLESTALYNAVHAQCAEMSGCAHGGATFQMIVSAYGMYIEQDCQIYADQLDGKQREANTAAKDAAGALAAARLESYDAHNSDAINQCLTNVRTDMFGDAACGANNAKCVDPSGRFLNAATGEPIYTPDFYMLEKQISLSGDTLRNNSNATYVSMLDDKKPAAAAALDKCRDVADYVWDEYLRQTLIDLSQRQLDAVNKVRNECVTTVSDCYDEKLDQLRQFANDISQENVGAQQISLTEELCHQKLETCAILYGGGPPGLQKLRDFVKETQTMKLENDCDKYLRQYAETVCSPINDNAHGYPYQCRFYRPGLREDPEIALGDDGASGMKDGGNSLYAVMRAKARDVCIRSDASDLPNEVEKILSMLMDDIKLKMDGELSNECKNLGSVWKSRTLAEYSDAQMDHDGVQKSGEFDSRVGANSAWGLCVENKE